MDSTGVMSASMGAMASDANHPRSADRKPDPVGREPRAAGAAEDQRAFAEIGTELLEAVSAAVPAWVRRSVESRMSDWAASGGVTGGVPGDRPGLRVEESTPVLADEAVIEALDDAGRRAQEAVMADLSILLATDVDDQTGNPLSILRSAVRFPTEVLRLAGVPPVVRDAFAERAFPDDIYDLSPASFADVDPSLHEPGLRWGAAKAHMVLARRRARGLR